MPRIQYCDMCGEPNSLQLLCDRIDCPIRVVGTPLIDAAKRLFGKRRDKNETTGRDHNPPLELEAA